MPFKSVLRRYLFLIVSLSHIPFCAPSLGHEAVCGVNDLSIEVAGWYNDGWDNESHGIYLKYRQIFSEVNPYWYNLGTSDDGPGANISDGSLYERAYILDLKKIRQVHQAQDLIIPTIGDNAAGQINRILSQASARQALLEHLVQTAVRWNYDGFDLNFEQGRPDGQAAFARFVDDLAKALHARGKRLSVTLKAANTAQAEAREIFDYALLAQTAADRFKLMMYDHHFDAGADTPGPIAEYHWFRACLKYILGRGLPAAKIQLGLHNIAWIWQTNQQNTLQFPFATWTMLEPWSKALKWNASARESWLDYRLQEKTYCAYVGDARTIAQRLPLVKSLGLAGVVFWTLGREDQRIYSHLAQTFLSRNKF